MFSGGSSAAIEMGRAYGMARAELIRRIVLLPAGPGRAFRSRCTRRATPSRVALNIDRPPERFRKETGAKVTGVTGEISTGSGRVGHPAEFGDACAFLCAASSGFIVSRNLLLDGGAFNSTMG
jgi:NAD(P)-dependent dehydrogenase (short-subunit alcohol dehydrogenase family)